MLKRIFARHSRRKLSESCRPQGIESLEPRTLLSSTWFVALNGSDSNPGTITQPFKTIQHAADTAKPGDTVDIRGGVYHQSVVVHHSGTVASRIVFQPYKNESVTIDGADPITGWTKSSGSVWMANDPDNLGAGNNQVFVDGTMVNDARWPNTSLDISHPTLEVAPAITATATSATIHDPALTQSANFWVGGTMHIAAGQGWVIQTGTVTASGPGFVTFSYTLHDATYQVPTAGNKYYLSGVAGALDSAGEWFRTAAGKLSLWTPTGDSPANHTVEVKDRLYGFDLSSAGFIRIQGIHFFACTIKTGAVSNDVVINQVTVQYPTYFSIDAAGFMPPVNGGIVLAGPYDILENSVIVDSAGDGVVVSGTGALVTNNLIHDVDFAAVDAAGIRIGGYGETISSNTIYNAGRSGILFSGNRCSILHNEAYDYGLQCTDLGGFYTASSNGNGTVVAYNKFHDGITGGFGGTGIMFDNASQGYIVHHNIVWNVNSALRMNRNTHNMQIYNNTFDATTWGMDKDSLVDDWTGVILENNIITHPIEFGTNVQLIDNISNHGMFVSAATGNFTLLPGAPAVDTGMLLPPYTNGYVGAAPDVGALELGVPPFATGVVASSLPKDPTAP